jgi:thiamine biosynthesis lipoprotein
MGSTAHVIVAGGDTLLGIARQRIAYLERRWTRFDPASELSRLNAAGSLRVSWETLELVDRCVTGWRETGGRFDPTVYDALVAHGYDRTLASVGSGTQPAAAVAAPGCAGVEVDWSNEAVSLPSGVHLDPGGIGKGLAADLVVRELMDLGADGAMVNIGGDLRAEGVAPQGPGWSIQLEGALGVVSIVAGAVTSSTPLKRRWGSGADESHHLIDPASGRPREHPHRFVAAVAAEAWWAEVATKDLLGRPAGADPLPGVAALVVDAGGDTHLIGGMESYL